MKTTTITFETFPTVFGDEDSTEINETMITIFTVVAEWAVRWVNNNRHMTIEDFIACYDYNDTDQMYYDAVLADTLISSKRIWRTDNV